MAISIGDVVAKLGLDTKGFDAGIKGVGATLKKHSKAIGIGMTALGATILGVGALSAKAFADFEAGMREVNSMMGLGQEEFAEFSNEVRDLASEIGVDAVESTAALYQAISAGIPKENVIDFLRIATKAAIGGVTDTETAVDGMTTAMNAFKIPLKDAQKIADVMFATVKGGKTTFEELSASMSIAAPLAASMGVEFEEVMAATASLTKQGVPTAQAMTQIRASLVSLTKPTKQMDLLLKDMGFETGEAALAALGYQGTMVGLRESAERTGIVLAVATGSVEALGAVLALSGDSALSAATDLEAMETATEGAGAATEAFEEINKGASRRLEAMTAKVQDLKLRIGEQLLPIITSLVEKVSKVIGAMIEWAEENPALVKVILVVVGVIGSLLAVLGPLLIFLPGIIAAAPLVAGAFTLMMGPVGLVIAAIVGLIAIGVLLWKNWDTIADFAKKTWGNILGFVKENWDKILALIFPAIGLPILFARNWDGVVDFFKGLWGEITNIFKGGINWIVDRINWLIRQLNKISFTLPSWIPGIGGKKFGVDIPEIPKFKHGGLVPGPIGAPVLAVVHGGERVSQAGRNGEFRTVDIHVEVDGMSLIEVLGEPLVDLIRIRTAATV